MNSMSSFLLVSIVISVSLVGTLAESESHNLPSTKSSQIPTSLPSLNLLDIHYQYLGKLRMNFQIVVTPLKVIQ